MIGFYISKNRAISQPREDYILEGGATLIYCLIMPKSRLAEMRAKNERIETNLYTFCLNPTMEAYKEICANSSVMNGHLSDLTSTWKAAVLFKWADEWGVDEDPDDKMQMEAEIFSSGFVKLDLGLWSKLMENPNLLTARKMLIIFCATGEYKYQSMAYQAMGIAELPESTRIKFMREFRAIQGCYINYIKERESKEPGWFNAHCDKSGLDPAVLDFSKIYAEADSATQKAREEQSIPDGQSTSEETQKPDAPPKIAAPPLAETRRRFRGKRPRKPPQCRSANPEPMAEILFNDLTA